MRFGSWLVGRLCDCEGCAMLGARLCWAVANCNCKGQGSLGAEGGRIRGIAGELVAGVGARRESGWG